MRNHNYQVIWIGLIVLIAALPSAAAGQKPEGPRLGLSKIGEDLYASYCTSCHGAKGRGDGPVAEYLKVTPADLTRLTESDGTFPFEEVSKKIDGREKARGHGSSDMPIWGDALRKAEGGGDEDMVKDKVAALTHFLWSIQAGGEEDQDSEPEP